MNSRKDARSVRTVTILGLALGYGIAAGGVAFLIADAHRTDRAREAERNRIVVAIREFQQRSGRMPASLNEVGVTPDLCLFDTVSYWPRWNDPLRFILTCNKHYWGPVPRVHWWYYDCDLDTWEYESEGI